MDGNPGFLISFQTPEVTAMRKEGWVTSSGWSCGHQVIRGRQSGVTFASTLHSRAVSASASLYLPPSLSLSLSLSLPLSFTYNFLSYLQDFLHQLMPLLGSKKITCLLMNITSAIITSKRIRIINDSS
jgi:hypothetical protein